MKKVFLVMIVACLLLGVVGGVLATEKVTFGVVEKEKQLSVGMVAMEKVDLTTTEPNEIRLIEELQSQKVTGWWAVNSLKLAMRKAIDDGVSVNTLVLVFLFPIVAAIVAFARQVVGMNGYGMILTSLLSMAFVSTGGLVGLVLLVFILGATVFGRLAIKKIRIPYLPKLAVLFWLVSALVLVMLIVSPTVGLVGLSRVGIFPIVIFILLAETFVEAQITRSLSTSLGMTLETVILAYLAYLIVGSYWVQSLVMLHPELTVLGVFAIDMLIGRYKGLRLSEMWRFRNMLSK